MANISVITPLYYGDKFIDGLLRRVFLNYCNYNRSTGGQVEFILVNDSPDDKIDITRHIDKFNLFLNKLCKACKNNKVDSVYNKHKLDRCDIKIKSYIAFANSKGQGGMSCKVVAQFSNDIGFSVKFINNTINSGIHKSRVNGLSHAIGDYILFLDQDDMITKNALNKFEGVISCGDTDIVIANGIRRWDNGRVEHLYRRKVAQRLALVEVIYLYGTDMIFSPGQCLIKRTSIPKYWYENILEVNGCDDCYLWLLMFNEGCKVAAIDSTVYCHVESESNYSNSGVAMYNSFVRMCDVLEKNMEYDKRKVDILRRRYEFKVGFKNSGGNGVKKFKLVLKNWDIVLATLFYKGCGYY